MTVTPTAPFRVAGADDVLGRDQSRKRPRVAGSRASIIDAAGRAPHLLSGARSFGANGGGRCIYFGQCLPP